MNAETAMRAWRREVLCCCIYQEGRILLEVISVLCLKAGWEFISEGGRST